MAERFNVLVTDEVDPEGIALLRAHPQIAVVERPTLPPAELLEEIAEYDGMVGRSATRISRELLDRAARLKVVGPTTRDDEGITCRVVVHQAQRAAAAPPDCPD